MKKHIFGDESLPWAIDMVTSH